MRPNNFQPQNKRLTLVVKNLLVKPDDALNDPIPRYIIYFIPFRAASRAGRMAGRAELFCRRLMRPHLMCAPFPRGQGYWFPVFAERDQSIGVFWFGKLDPLCCGLASLNAVLDSYGVERKPTRPAQISNQEGRGTWHGILPCLEFRNRPSCESSAVLFSTASAAPCHPFPWLEPGILPTQAVTAGPIESDGCARQAGGAERRKFGGGWRNDVRCWLHLKYAKADV